jgi:hypothetical protein
MATYNEDYEDKLSPKNDEINTSIHKRNHK